MSDYLYPVTITRDRYGGCYSGAIWTAFNSYDVPAGPADGDTECMMFWEHPRMPIGKGETPAAALADLERAVKEWAETWGRERSMSDTADRLRAEFGPFWDKADDGIELNGPAAMELCELGREAAAEIERVHAGHARLLATLRQLVAAPGDHMTACDRTMGATHPCTCGAIDARLLLQAEAGIQVKRDAKRPTDQEMLRIARELLQGLNDLKSLTGLPSWDHNIAEMEAVIRDNMSPEVVAEHFRNARVPLLNVDLECVVAGDISPLWEDTAPETDAAREQNSPQRPDHSNHYYCKHGVILYGKRCVNCEREQASQSRKNDTQMTRSPSDPSESEGK